MAYEKFKRLWGIWEGFRASRCRATEVPPKKQSPEALLRTPPLLYIELKSLCFRLSGQRVCFAFCA